MTTKTINDIVHTFPNGATIHLRRIISIGAIEKNINNGNIFIPVHVTGMDKPIEILLGNSIATTPPHILERVETALNDFQTRWFVYLHRKENGGNK